ncbi:MAG: amino acid racemase [Cyclobacteriaceae bacterium]
MRKLGLIGGTSWHSTIDYYRRINQITNDRLGTKVNPELQLFSINIELMFSQDWDLISAKFIEAAKILEKGGVDALVLCANTTHRLYDEISRRVHLPFVHIADAVGEEARSNNLNKIGLIGTKPTMTETFISGYIHEKFGVECIMPTEDSVSVVHNVVVDELVQGQFTEDARISIIAEMNKLKDSGTEAIVLGCTEFPELLRGVDYPLPLYDTLEMHCQKCVDYILR